MDSKNKKNWVDFKTIKELVSLEMVLERYGLMDGLRKSGKNLVGCCPIHKGSNPRQFSVDLQRNIFNCFGNCKAGGNVLDFVALMEFGNKEIESIRRAALMLKDWFSIDSNENEDECSKLEQTGLDQESKLVRKGNKEENQAQGEPINPPLTFQLKNLVPKHKFFKERGIEPATIEHFGLGYCKKGLMKGRIAIPIHNEKGELVAYCGRAVNDEQIEKEGKYKLPPKFVKSAVVYNLHRQRGPSPLILVESFLSVFWLYQSGLKNVVALMGSRLDQKQEELLIGALEGFGASGKIILLFDADEDGRKCTDDCLIRLGRKLFVRAVDISPYAKKPHQLKPDQIHHLL